MNVTPIRWGIPRLCLGGSKRLTDTGVSYPAIDRTVVSNPVGIGIGIGIAIGFGLAALFRLPIATATPIPIPKTLFKPL